MKHAATHALFFIFMLSLFAGTFPQAISRYAHAQDAATNWKEGLSPEKDAGDAAPAEESFKPLSKNTKSLATQFYSRCKEKPDPALPGNSQDEYCTCLAAQLYSENLNEQERIYVATGKGTPMDTQKVRDEIYVPCVGIPTRIEIYADCQNDPVSLNTTRTYGALDDYCRCLVDDLDYYISNVAPALLRSKIKREHYAYDPVSAIMNSSGFKSTYANVASACRSIYGRKD